MTAAEIKAGCELAARTGDAYPDRYGVHVGPGVMRAYVVDLRTHKTVLTLAGVDRVATADRVAAALNASRMETPVHA